MQVIIIDYGMSNLGSISHAVSECGGEATISDDPRDLNSATHIVLPGVGAYTDGMKNLDEGKWIAPIRKAALEDKIPFLGICLGMQLLSDIGYEGGETKGLGLIPGKVERFVSKSDSERIPHVGWNEIYQQKDSPLLESIADGTDFYFVHSYHFIPQNKSDILCTTPYCGGFVSALQAENIFGTQFHPEKSSRPGFQLLTNFLNL